MNAVGPRGYNFGFGFDGHLIQAAPHAQMSTAHDLFIVSASETPRPVATPELNSLSGSQAPLHESFIVTAAPFTASFTINP